MSQESVRNVVAAGCLIGGIVIHYSGGLNFGVGLMLWFILAATMGYMRPFPWIIVAAPLPWLIGVVGGVATGTHETLGDAWYIPLALSTIVGILGIIFGVSARRTGSKNESD